MRSCEIGREGSLDRAVCKNMSRKCYLEDLFLKQENVLAMFDKGERGMALETSGNQLNTIENGAYDGCPRLKRVLDEVKMRINIIEERLSDLLCNT